MDCCVSYRWCVTISIVCLFPKHGWYWHLAIHPLILQSGLDGNVDLTGITDSGYTDTNKPETDTPDAGEEIEKYLILMLKLEIPSK